MLSIQCLISSAINVLVINGIIKRDRTQDNVLQLTVIKISLCYCSKDRYGLMEIIINLKRSRTAFDVRCDSDIGMELLDHC